MAKKKATKVARPPQEGVMETPNPRSKRVKLSQVKTEEAARPDAVASAVTPDTATSCTSVAAFSRPTPEECQWAVNVLSEIHPEVVERNKSRRRATHSCGAQDDIVDGVVSTMLSQNTTSANSTAAFRNLKQVFPTMGRVYRDCRQRCETAGSDSVRRFGRKKVETNSRNVDDSSRGTR